MDAGRFQLYIPYMDYRINNAELTLLLLIWETPGANGYRLRTRVADRGMEAWAGVSASSIYVVVKKLEREGWIASAEDRDKRSKGPKGRVFSILPKGETALRAAIRHGLSHTREYDPRFNIALSGLRVLGPQDAAACLHHRAAFLAAEQTRLSTSRQAQAQLPLEADLLFARIENAITAEKEWLAQAILRLEQPE